MKHTELLETYRIWQDSNFNDADMAKAFDKRLIRIEVLELIKDYQALEAENEILKATISALKQDCRDRIGWILEELQVPTGDRLQIITEAIVATTKEMP